ncbi:hypothetical protein [uncultured Sphingomonas sp.]|nr:hypothetical protein [uncultured Sphingomonas sp.]
MVDDHSRQRRLVQARSNVPDQLERLSDRFDVLIVAAVEPQIAAVR